MDEEETQVKIDLQTKPEPIRGKAQPKRTPTAKPTPPLSPGFPISGKWIFVAVSIAAIIAIFILMNVNWNIIYTPTIIGKTGPAGGFIFYDKGSYSDGWRYLEVAPKSTEWTGKQWGSKGTLIGGTETGIGTGQNNTTKIATWLNSHSETGKAVQLCDTLVYGGYADWFLPSLDELYLMHRNLKRGGGFGGTHYWSSSEYNAYYAWTQAHSNGPQGSHYKDYHPNVRAVRAF